MVALPGDYMEFSRKGVEVHLRNPEGSPLEEFGRRFAGRIQKEFDRWRSSVEHKSRRSLTNGGVRLKEKFERLTIGEEMDTDVIEILAKGLYAKKKRKGKAPGEGLKWEKVGTSDLAAPIDANVAPMVHPKKDVISTTYANIVEGESLPPEPTYHSTGDCAPNPSTNKGKERRKGKAAIVKKACKAHQYEPSWSSGDDQVMDHFNNLDIIQNLTDKFALPKKVDHLADLDQRQFIWESLRTILREKKRQEVEGRVTGLEAHMSKSILEAMARAVEEFRVSPKMKYPNITFG
ncbi:hypothetical protein COCNU_scaffold004391G000010 [Cocos nucifera]|nr:hypothetical protein [Cocos nucifera]